MKTLKLHSGKEINQKTDFQEDWEAKEWIHISEIREWLTQKRQEKRAFSGNPHWSYYDELLEELNQ